MSFELWESVFQKVCVCVCVWKQMEVAIVLLVTLKTKCVWFGGMAHTQNQILTLIQFS